MLSNNRIESLEGMEKLHSLQLLVADDNKLRELPRDIWQNVNQVLKHPLTLPSPVPHKLKLICNVKEKPIRDTQAP